MNRIRFLLGLKLINESQPYAHWFFVKQCREEVPLVQSRYKQREGRNVLPSAKRQQRTLSCGVTAKTRQC